MMNEKALCTARELAIGYGKTPLLSDICLGVQPGQILTLIGPNGAGKSTLLRTLAGQLAPMGGAVLLEGRSLADYTGTQRAQKLALMAPHSRRMELTTCFDFVSAGRYPYTGRLGILSAEDRQQVHRALELVGAAQLADRDFNRISDGQRQRILLARALCQQPEVILLDEPTSFLDIKGKIELLTILKELAHTGQLAVIWLSGTGFGNDPLLAHFLCQQDLSQHVVDLVCTGVVQVFPLQVDLAAAQISGHAVCIVQH